jgi:predicted nucleic acid-binding protein
VAALDSSVCIPALADWHEAHERSRPLAVGAVIPAHALVECYSVLTRLPDPDRLGVGVIREVLAARFPPGRVLASPPALQRSLVGRLADAGVAGGASYDGLVGLTAAHHGLVLLTRDRRAARTYDALGVEYRLV